MLNPSAARDPMAAVRGVKPVRPPDAGSEWQGVPHAELLDRLRAEAQSRGWATGVPVCHLFREGAELTAAFNISGGPGSGAMAMPGIGVRHGNSRRRSLTFYAGM